ncbi:MAG: YncE family protein, partial [Bacillati bacterium ANGP1]
MRRFGPALAFVAVLGLSAGVGANAAPFAYIPNASGNNVSVIDTATNAIVATVGVGDRPYGAAVSPDGSRVYVANFAGQSISVIDAATNTVTATVALPPLGELPLGVAVAPDGSRVYVTAVPDGFFVIDTATNAVVSAQSLPGDPFGVAVAPDGSRVYVTNHSPAVLVIDTATNSVVQAVTVGSTADQTHGVAVTPDGARVYVTHAYTTPRGTVDAIDTARNMVVATVEVGSLPLAYGQFIQPRIPSFPFASFRAQLSVSRETGSFVVNGTFALATGSREIDLLTQPLTLGIGGFTAAIPAGSFREDRHGMFVFDGVINGAPLDAVVVRYGRNRFTFKAEG